MNIKEIAAKLIALREGSSSALIMNGKLRDELGFEGYSEALRRRWIVADMEGSGMVQFNQNMTVIQEMRSLAEEHKKEKAEKCGKKNCKCGCKEGEKCTCDNIGESQVQEKVMSYTTMTKGNDVYHYDAAGKKVRGEAPKDKRSMASPVAPSDEYVAKKKKGIWRSEAHSAALQHANRSLTEIATYGLGNPDRPAPRDTMATPSASPEATPKAPEPSPERSGKVDVGSDVKIVQDGKEYVGKVSKVKDDGKYDISFAGERPAAVRDYDKTEITPIK